MGSSVIFMDPGSAQPTVGSGGSGTSVLDTTNPSYIAVQQTLQNVQTQMSNLAAGEAVTQASILATGVPMVDVMDLRWFALYDPSDLLAACAIYVYVNGDTNSPIVEASAIQWQLAQGFPVPPMSPAPASYAYIQANISTASPTMTSIGTSFLSNVTNPLIQNTAASADLSAAAADGVSVAAPTTDLSQTAAAVASTPVVSYVGSSSTPAPANSTTTTTVAATTSSSWIWLLVILAAYEFTRKKG